MNIILFIIGLCTGFFAKLGMDYYANWQAEQKQLKVDMENILTNFRAIEKMKELDKKYI